MPTNPTPELPEGGVALLPFECFSDAGTYRAELSATGGWIILAVGFHGDSAFVDWTDTRDDAVRLARMHADMELPL